MEQRTQEQEHRPAAPAERVDAGAHAGPASSTPEALLSLQARAGNRATVAYIRRMTGDPPAENRTPQAETGTRSRLEEFVAAAMARGLSRDEALELFDVAGGRQVDPVTGFGGGKDRQKTLDLAVLHADKTGTPTFQVDADLANLGGLNAVAGHSGTDRVYGTIAAIVRRWLESTGYQVEAFRSGGTLSYVVIARGATDVESARQQLWSVLGDAEKQVKGYAANEGLSGIDNPRGGIGGIGINVDVLTSATAAKRSPQDGSTVTPLEPMTQEPTTAFVSGPERRRQQFFAIAAAHGVEGAEADALWKAVGAGNPDALTGFASAADRVPTVEGAIKHVAGGGAACYVEVDIRNVGGMNKVSKALGDEVVRDLAGAARAAVASVHGDVTAIRHGGDEVSFVVVADGGSAQLKQQLETALSAARERAASEMSHLEWVPHPKHPRSGGTGIFFGVAAIAAGSDPEAVLHDADAQVERMKTST